MTIDIVELIPEANRTLEQSAWVRRDRSGPLATVVCGECQRRRRTIVGLIAPTPEGPLYIGFVAATEYGESVRQLELSLAAVQGRSASKHIKLPRKRVMRFVGHAPETLIADCRRHGRLGVEISLQSLKAAPSSTTLVASAVTLP